MQLSQKCQYAIRALLELSKADSLKSLKSADIAQRQKIPQKFLENILSQLKGLGFIVSIRGKQGGYQLLIPPKKLSVGLVIRAFDGSFMPVACLDGQGRDCQIAADLCVLKDVWQRAEKALSDIYDNISFAELAEKSKKTIKHNLVDFCI